MLDVLHPSSGGTQGQRVVQGTSAHTQRPFGYYLHEQAAAAQRMEHQGDKLLLAAPSPPSVGHGDELPFAGGQLNPCPSRASINPCQLRRFECSV